jgi:hypothetical protein
MRLTVGETKEDEFFRTFKLGQGMPVQVACIADTRVKPVKPQHSRAPVPQQQAIGLGIIADAVSAVER